MNKNLLIGGAIAAVIVVIGGYLLFGRSQSNPQTATPKQDGKMMEKKSFRDLLSLGTNQTCTFSDTESESSGTVYMGNNNVRGDFSTSINGAKAGSHMILSDTDMYVWMDTATQGFKMSRDAIEDVQDNLPDNGPKTVDINKQVDYQCSPWSVDTSKFSPPSDISFTDQTKMMEDAQKMMKEAGVTAAEAMEGNQAACSACNSLPADAQAQCKSALKCN